MKKYNKANCEICGEPTTQVFNIRFVPSYICEDCESLIVKQSIIDRYK